ncbi:hypothetical protein ABVS18_004577 [Vibrio parahaemolyticus]
MKHFSFRDIPSFLFTLLFYASCGLVNIVFIAGLMIITLMYVLPINLASIPDVYEAYSVSYSQMGTVSSFNLLTVHFFISALSPLHDSISDRLFSSESSKASEQEKRA